MHFFVKLTTKIFTHVGFGETLTLFGLLARSSFVPSVPNVELVMSSSAVLVRECPLPPVAVVFAAYFAVSCCKSFQCVKP